MSWRVREAHAEQLRAAKASLPAAKPKAPEFAFPSFLIYLVQLVPCSCQGYICIARL